MLKTLIKKNSIDSISKAFEIIEASKFGLVV